MKGKQLSLWAKLGAAVFVVAGFILGAIFRWSLDTRDLIYVGLLAG
jgi:hypothetical protein